MFSLRKTIYTTILLMVVILSIIFLLGARQYLLAGRYTAVIDQSEKLVFRFSTVKERITAAMLENRYDQMAGITSEAEAMNGDLNRVLESDLIPGEYKLTFLDQLDLSGVILLLRKLETLPQKETASQLSVKVRQISDQLMRFDRIVAGQAKVGLVEFQSVVIGGLAMVLCLFSFLVLLWYRQVIMPLLGLVTRCKGEAFGRVVLEHDPKACNEVVELTQAVNGLIVKHGRQEKAAAHRDLLLKAVAAAGEGIRQARSCEELNKSLCRDLMQDKDHALVWIGQTTAGNDSLTPLAVDGSTTMDRDEYLACLDFLLSQVRARGKGNDPSQRALAQGSPVVARDILANAPRGLLKNTPFSAGPLQCAALPLRWQDEVFGVLTIYSLAKESFQATDMEILRLLVDEAALACHALKVRAGFDLEIARLGALLDISPDLLLILAPCGTVFWANRAARKRLWQAEDQVVSVQLCDLLFKDQAAAGARQLREAIARGTADSFGMEFENLPGRHVVTLAPRKNAAGRVEHLLVLARELTEEGDFNALTVQICGLAAMGELAAGVAHEVTNLVNGIINYAQVLFDEIGPNGGTQAELLRKVMDEGERIGDVLRQLLFLSRGKRQTLSRLSIEHVVQTAYALVERQMKNDGIIATISLANALPPVDVDLEYMQLVLLCIFNNARQALNGRYPGLDGQKRLTVTGEVVFSEGRSWLRTSVTDWGGGIDAQVLPKVFDPLFSTKPAGEGSGLGLTISKILVEDHGGQIKIESVVGDHATVSIELPVAVAG